MDISNDLIAADPISAFSLFSSCNRFGLEWKGEIWVAIECLSSAYANWYAIGRAVLQTASTGIMIRIYNFNR